MELFLVFAFSTIILGSVNAIILSESQDITNDLDRQFAELYEAKGLDDSLSAAAEYFKAPQAFNKIFKNKARKSFAATAEHFKSPDANELQSNALNLVHERLAAAAAYLRAPEPPKRSTSSKVGNSRAVAAEYIKTPESSKPNIRNGRTEGSLAAAAEYFQAPEYHPRFNVAKKNFAAVKKSMFRSITKAPRRLFVRLG